MFGSMLGILRDDAHYMATRLHFKYLYGRRHAATRVLINGSPKSGTTWMLNLIASVPGYTRAGNFDGRIERYRDVAPGQVVHGHDWYRAELGQILVASGVRVILMLRDPRDQLVSRMFHIKRSCKHAWHDEFQSLSEAEALALCIEGREGLPGMDDLIRLTETWLDAEAEFLCIRYEDLVADPVQYLSAAFRYLDIQDPRDELAAAVVRRNRFERLSVGRRIWRAQRKPGQADANSHFRKGIVGDWTNHLTPELKRRFKEVAGRQLIRLGYEQDIDW